MEKINNETEIVRDLVYGEIASLEYIDEFDDGEITEGGRLYDLFLRSSKSAFCDLLVKGEIPSSIDFSKIDFDAIAREKMKMFAHETEE